MTKPLFDKRWFIIAWDIEGNTMRGPYVDKETAQERARDMISDNGLDEAEVKLTALDLYPVEGLEKAAA